MRYFAKLEQSEAKPYEKDMDILISKIRFYKYDETVYNQLHHLYMFIEGLLYFKNKGEVFIDGIDLTEYSFDFLQERRDELWNEMHNYSLKFKEVKE